MESLNGTYKGQSMHIEKWGFESDSRVEAFEWG
jgi:hypothetical protein